MKKLITLALCLCLTLALLAGCAQAQPEAPAEETAVEETAAPTAEPDPNVPGDEAEAAPETPAGIGLGGTGFETYPADTVVATVNGSDVTWMEYYYWLNYYTQYIQQLAAQNGVVLDGWDGHNLSATDTNEQVVILNAQVNLILDHAIFTEMEKRGVTLTEEDKATLQSALERQADSVVGDQDGAASEEELAVFEEYLMTSMHVDRDYFEWKNSVSLLADDGFIDAYGADGEKMTDEEVAAYAQDNGLMAAKHILIATIDTETRQPLSEEEVAEKTQRAQDLYDQLQAVADDHDAMVALFDELTAEYTDDTGYEYYPDGYVFEEGQMVPEFEEAVKTLEEGGLSGIVESDYGYHIILRLPIDPDAAVNRDSAGNVVTLRKSAAYSQYNNEMLSWQDEADVQWNEGFEAPDLQAIFG